MYINVLLNKVKVIFNYILKFLLYNSFWMKDLQVNINFEVCFVYILYLQCGFSRNIIIYIRVFGSIINSDISQYKLLGVIIIRNLCMVVWLDFSVIFELFIGNVWFGEFIS